MHNLKKIYILIVFVVILSSITTTVGANKGNVSIDTSKLQFVGNLNDESFVQSLTDKLNDDSDETPKAQLYFLRGLAYVQQKKLVEAADDFALSIANGNVSRDSYYQCAATNYEAGRYNVAIEYCNKTILIKKDDFEAYYLMGLSYLKTEGKDQLAIEAFNQSIKINSKYKEAYQAVVATYLKDATKNKIALIATSNKLVELYPTDAESYIRRGAVNIKIKNYESAIADFHAAITINPKNTYLYLASAELYENMNKFNEAVAQVKKYLDVSPTSNDSNSAYAYLRLGILYLKLADEKTAIDYLRKSETIQGNPTIPEIIAGCYYKSEDSMTAIKIYEDGIDKYPKSERLYNGVAEKYISLKDYSNALRILNKGIENIPASRMLRELRVKVAYALGDTELAKQDRVYLDSIIK